MVGRVCARSRKPLGRSIRLHLHYLRQGVQPALGAMTTLPAPSLGACSPQQALGSWADLPAELLRSIACLALQPPAPTAAAAAAAAVPCQRRLPPLAQAAQLLAAMEGCCRSWRQALAALPLRAAIGASPLPADAAAALLPLLTGVRHPLEALHFEARGRRGCRPGRLQHLAIDLLASDALAAAAGAASAGWGGKPQHGRLLPGVPSEHYSSVGGVE